MDVLEMFSDRARKVMTLANQEAQRAGREQVGPEHILLGLLVEGRGVAPHVLQNLGVSLPRARGEVERLTLGGRRPLKASPSHLPLSPPAQQVVSRAAQESAALNHRYVGTEHLLLALLHDQDNIAVQTMRNLGLDLLATRAEVVALLGLGSSEAAVHEPAPPSAPAPRPERIDPARRVRVGIVGVSGYGGGEALRLCAGHPNFDIVHVAGESSAGQKLDSRFPGLPSEIGGLDIAIWDASQLPEIDLLLASLPTGQSRDALARVPASTRIVDIGGDHRFAEGWTYGLADIWPDRIRDSSRVANPGCYPAAAITALAPLLRQKLIAPAGIIIDAKSGVSGTGRGGGGTFGFAEVNEDLSAYGLLKHSHVAEMERALGEIGSAGVSLSFTPHLVPMTRGLLATCYARGGATTTQALDAARAFYADRPFVRVVDQPPHTKWAAGSNLAFVSYACDPDRGVVIALCAIDNLGKGAAGQAIQNANLMCGLEESAGLAAAPLWP